MYRVTQKFVFCLLIVGITVCRAEAVENGQNKEFPLR